MLWVTALNDSSAVDPIDLVDLIDPINLVDPIDPVGAIDPVDLTLQIP